MEAWVNGDLGTAAFPAMNVPADLQATVDGMDHVFTAFDSTVNPEVQRDLIARYDQVITAGGAHGLQTRAALEAYAAQQLRAGLVYDDDRARDVFGPVDPATSVADVLNGIRNGVMVFRRGSG